MSVKKIFKDIKDYQFIDLLSETDRISFDDKEIVNFEIHEIDNYDNHENRMMRVKQERDSAKENHFVISPIVRKHRGIEEQENTEIQEKMNTAVNRKVTAIKRDAFELGYKDGYELGKKKSFDKYLEENEKNLLLMKNLVEGIVQNKKNVLEKQKDDVVSIIKLLVKKIILKEIENDGSYIERLIEKLIYEIGDRENLTVRLPKKVFSNIPQVLENLERRIGKLTNLQIDIFLDSDIDESGVVLESKDLILDGTIKEQMKYVDELLETL